MIVGFSTIPEEEMWSAITAIGHIETGSKVKYTRPEGRKYKNTTDDPLYLADNHPFTGKYESGMDDAYGFVSSANALGRFGIKETLLELYPESHIIPRVTKSPFLAPASFSMCLKELVMFEIVLKASSSFL